MGVRAELRRTRTLRDAAMWLVVVAIAFGGLAASIQLHAAMPILEFGDSIAQATTRLGHGAQNIIELFAKAMLHAALAGTAVIVVLTIAKRFSQVVSGIVAGLPLTTAPSLILLANAGTPDYAIRAATSAMWVAAGSAFFALGFAYLCARLSTRWTTFVSLAFSVVIACLFLSWPVSYREALIMTLLICAAVRWLLPRDAELFVKPQTAFSSEASVSVKTTGLFTALIVGAVSLSSAWLPAAITGLFVALPIIGATLAYRTQVNAGTGATRKMLAGYVDGCVAKIVFCFIFAYLLRKYGVGLSTMAGLSLCLASSAILLARSLRKSTNLTTSMPESASYETPEQSIHLHDRTVPI